MARETLSIVIPAYNEEETIEITFNAINEELKKENIPFDILFVNDGSKDNTWKIIKKLSKENEHVSGLKFSKNFGQSSAIIAGVTSCKGDCVVVMDCDLQHPISAVVQMYKMWKNSDVEIIEGRKNQRQKETLMHKIFATGFYKILKLTSGFSIENFSDFKLLDRKVIETIKEMGGKEVYFKAISEIIGFETEFIYYDVSERIAGNSKFSFLSLVKLSINSITSHSSVPMHLVSFCGGIFFVFAVILIIRALFLKFSGTATEGFTTVIILLLITGSVIMFSLGIIGVYIAKIYNEIRGKTRYIISEKC